MMVKARSWRPLDPGPLRPPWPSSCHSPSRSKPTGKSQVHTSSCQTEETRLRNRGLLPRPQRKVCPPSPAKEYLSSCEHQFPFNLKLMSCSKESPAVSVRHTPRLPDLCTTGSL